LIRQTKLKQKAFREENKRKEMEAELEIHRNLQKERDRISRDLHDNVGSQLTHIILSWIIHPICFQVLTRRPMIKFKIYEQIAGS